MKDYEKLFKGHRRRVVEAIFSKFGKDIYKDLEDLAQIYEKNQEDWVLALIRKIVENSKDELTAYKEMASIYITIKNKGKEKRIELLDLFLDEFPELNDHIADMLYHNPATKPSNQLQPNAFVGSASQAGKKKK
jgi:hypothetical protein